MEMDYQVQLVVLLLVDMVVLHYNTIDFITIATTGDSQDFGDQTAAWSTL